MLKNLLLVGAGGFVGSIARYLVFVIFDKRYPSLYPWSTFTVNILGSLILGIIMGLMVRTTIVNDNFRLLMAVGFCGSFTTFSTFAFENLSLIQQKAIPTALIYMSASLFLGLLTVFAGYWIGKSIV